MRKLFIHKLTWLFLTCLLACGESSAPNDLRIVGGQTVVKGSLAALSTVALVRKDGSSYESFCSGSLIAPNLVLTAAHCAEDAKDLRNFQVLFGLNVKDPGSSIRNAVAMQTFKTSGSRFFPNFDIAWIKLDAPAPSSYTPAEILRSPKNLVKLNGQEDRMVLAGFGRTSTFCDRSEPGCTGTLHEVKSKLKHFVDAAHFVSLLVIGPKPGHGSCNGDSGGPVFTVINNRNYLLGALNGKSPLLNSEAVLDSKACESGEAIYTFAGSYVDWIEATAKVELPQDATSNPDQSAKTLMHLDQLPSNPSLEDYIEFDNHLEAVWETTEAIMAGFKDPKRRPVGDFDAIITNPSLTADAIRDWQDFHHNGLIQSLGTFVRKYEQLVDARPIGEMAGLRVLSLVNDRFDDLTPLGRLVNLEELTIQNNYDFQLKKAVPMNLRFLGELPKLKVLDLSNNARNIDLTRIPWHRLGSLESLDLSNNPGTLDLSRIPWGLLRALRSVTIDNSGIDNIEALGQARALKAISVRNNKVRSLKGLERLTALEFLDVTMNGVSDFTPISRLPLKRLKALSNPQKVAYCPGTANCTYSPSDLPDFASYCRFAANLTEEDRLAWTGGKTVLRLLAAANAMTPSENQCDIADANLRRMTSLNLSGANGSPKIDDLRPLSPLKHMEVLILDHNEIVDLRPIQSFSRLRTLNLASNKVESIEVLMHLPALRELNLDNNNISFLGALKEKIGLVISFLGNPLGEG